MMKSKDRNKPCECSCECGCETMLMELKKMEYKNLVQEYQKYESDEVFGEFQSGLCNLFSVKLGNRVFI